jgi:hypothetical protein
VCSELVLARKSLHDQEAPLLVLSASSCAQYETASSRNKHRNRALSLMTGSAAASVHVSSQLPLDD